MPHITLDYSANLEDVIDLQAFCDHLRVAASEIETFPMPGIRVRALKAAYYSIADGDPKHGFVDISVRLRGGRPQAVKAEATEALFEAARKFLEPALVTHSIALSLEMRDIDPALSPKTGTIRDHLKDA